MIGNGKYAWAVETVPHQPGMTVSVFDGSRWSGAISTDKYAEGSRVKTYVNGSYASLGYSSPTMQTNFVIQHLGAGW